MSAPQPSPATELTPRIKSGLAFAHTLYAVLLVLAMPIFTAFTLRGWNPDTDGTGVIFYFGILVPIVLGFAAYQFRWARRLSRGELSTGAGLTLGAILLLGSSPLEIRGVLLLFGLFDELPESIRAIEPLFNGILMLFTVALGLATIIALLRSFAYRERAARWIGAFSGALIFSALAALIQTLPAFFVSFAALGVERSLVGLTPALATFGVSVAYAPFGINGSGGELWPIALVAALTLPVAFFLFRGARTLLAGGTLRPTTSIALGALVVLSSIAPFNGDRLIGDPLALIGRASLPGLLVGLALIAHAIKQRLIVILLLILGAGAVLAELYDWARMVVSNSGDGFANLINGLAVRFDPSEILYSLTELLLFAALVAFLLHAGVREQSDERAA